jgi:tetratricopeptide (TPR) repeat protein
LVRGLGLYIASEQEFVRPTNSLFIQKNLEDLSNLFKNLKTHPLVGIQGLSFNQTVMVEQLDQAVCLFKNDRKALAREKFNSALNLCVSCHTQSPGTLKHEEAKIFTDKDIEKLKVSKPEKAELYFISRDFDKSMTLYDQFIRSSKKTDDDEFIYKALDRQLIYFVKIKKSFPLAKSHFETYLKENILNDKIAQEVREWVKVLSEKTLWENYDPIKVKEEEIEKFMNTFMADDDEGPVFSPTNSSEVYDLNLSEILIDYYNAHPDTKHGAKILYWMANLDKRINDDLFFSLGDYYLLACMENYPKDPMAKECYDSYVDDLEINYSDKKKPLPPEVRAKINKLQKLLNIKDEIE